MKRNFTLLLTCLSFVSFIFAQMPEPTIIMKTEKFAGESFAMHIAEASAVIIVDWGDGNYKEIPVKSTFDSSPTLVVETLPVDNATIKVYGNLLTLRIPDQMLTSLFIGVLPKFRRLDCQNNLLPSIEGDLSKLVMCGNYFMYGNLFEACAIEDIYSKLPSKVAETIPGLLFIANSLEPSDQNQFVIDSKISIANALHWNVCDQGLGYSAGYDKSLIETTGIGCQTGLKNVINNSMCYYDKNSGLLNIRTESITSSANLSIYDLRGRMCYAKLIKRNEKITVNLKDYPSGIYCVKIDNQMKKILIAH